MSMITADPKDVPQVETFEFDAEPWATARPNAAAPDQASRRSGGMNSCSSSQSREAVPNAATSSVGRSTKGFVAPTPWMRPMKRPSHSSV